MALCTDAVLRNGEVVGDPTEDALVVLAEKGGIDVTALREERHPAAEIPFDSDYKFMATFHSWTGERGRKVVRCFLKGAPDVLARRADRYLGGEEILPFDDTARQRNADEANAALAAQGMRMLAIGAEDFPADRFLRLLRPPEGPARPRRGPARPGRHRRPAACRGAAGDLRVPRRRHPGPDDHRGPCSLGAGSGGSGCSPRS